ncbi:uncharacterized protein LOC110027465 [Phalaenopsis equestris]|uniref:uncharacterized protein LOC110027465 n=1 Tax=Phalaenopsis equestris TaxID=78828 RepID=UPI0009E46E8D|nr:uncharacterized protein LOC110027465 [Phalaenopsis equestris]
MLPAFSAAGFLLRPKEISAFYTCTLHARKEQQHKHRAFLQFLRRIGKASRTPKDVLFIIRDVKPRLLASYDVLDYCNNKEDCFLKRMIVDDCFTLKVMLAEKRIVAGEGSEYDLYDSVFGAMRKSKFFLLSDLKQDKLLFKNQISFLALTILAAVDGSGIVDISSLIKNFYIFLDLSAYGLTDQVLRRLTESSCHILDLYGKIFTSAGEYLPSNVKNLQSATELRNAEISFLKSNTKSFRDTSFNDDVLSLPPLDIDDNTESILFNLMSFEHLHMAPTNEVTTYVFFMDGLIKSIDNVALLRTEKIIMGWVGYDENIVTLFNRIKKGATLTVNTVDIPVDVNSRLNSYCNKRMHWRRAARAILVQTYLQNWDFTSFSTHLKNPWVFTFLDDSFFMALSIIQTVYTVRQFYQCSC